ncbi:protoporphyrinogen/coproporphyrinogen oxidase [Actinomadura alba]|uniref:FAD-dependent oxidoreductase n=1 Tax=Actinomadura alba TaxID=406431 RepID=A0ABR7LUC5_9ACTN|nr:FAD-dependent oxidoreductase [Actinomadura alba]MBC6468411.1 FAD-dependent oxidoreductase [Actinomadura alba]
MTDIDVAVIGAGISGLAAAFRLRAAGRSAEVFEAEETPGGRMRSRRHDGHVIDAGTQTLATHGYSGTWRLIRDVGMSDEEVPAVKGLVAVWRNQRAHPGVGHWRGALNGAGLSVGGNMALTRLMASLMASMRRYDVRRPGDSPLGVTTVTEFGSRHRRELFDYVLRPAVETAWGWSPERSCIAPLISTMLATRGLMGWRTYRGGMDALAVRLAERVPVHTGRPLEEVKESSGSSRLVFADGQSLTARSVVLAVPAPVALSLYPSMPADERRFLRQATYAPMIRVSCLLESPLEPGCRNVYTLMLPDCEDGVLSGMTFEQNKISDRVPAGRGLITLLSTPRMTAELIDRPDDEVVQRLLPRAETYVPGLGAQCHESFVHRFRHAAPEATPAAVALHGEFMNRPARAVEYAGDWVHLRPSSESAVQSAELAVSRVQAAAGD